MNNFKDIFEKYDWEEVKTSIYTKTKADVRAALQTLKPSLEDMKALLSPAAETFLENMAAKSVALTRKRFGKTIQLFAPIYLSNECQNICTYCGFSLNNKIPRKTLTDKEILKEVEVIKAGGFKHILLVTGEANHTVHVNYFLKAVALIKSHIPNISIEFQPLKTNEYTQLQEAGVYAVLVYQETYHQEVYKKYHPKGKKSNFFYRLDTPDRVGKAEMHKVGLGVLLGLEDWRVDSFFCALHLNYMQQHYWKTKYSVSFPRMRPAEGMIDPAVIVTDRNLVQLITAYRIFNEHVELSISTRESEQFRNHVIPLGVTSMSAGSKTNPGGYSVAQDSLEQFQISDERPVQEIAKIIEQAGYDPVYKNWEKNYANSKF